VRLLREASLAALVEFLGRSDPASLSSVVECLAFGAPDPYSVVRDIWACIAQRSGEAPKHYLLEPSTVAALYEVWHRRHSR